MRSASCLMRMAGSPMNRISFSFRSGSSANRPFASSMMHCAFSVPCIMLDANGRVADEPDQFLLQIRLALKWVIQFARDGVEVERVHREIPAFRILFPRAED